jgi:HAD superfamily hydrolase (TIGR01549 family)
VITASATDTVSTILFDADGVLQRTAPGWREELISFLGPRAAADGDAFLYEIFVAEVPTMTGRTDFGEPLAEILHRFGVSASVDEVLAPSTRIIRDAAMLDAVQELRAAGVRCCLATNQQSRRAAFMRANLGYDQTFDEQFYSCDLGLAKPDPDYFTAIVDRLGARAGSILFVDDKEENVAGARAAGLRAEHFTRNSGRPMLELILRRHGLSGA